MKKTLIISDKVDPKIFQTSIVGEEYVILIPHGDIEKAGRFDDNFKPFSADTAARFQNLMGYPMPQTHRDICQRTGVQPEEIEVIYTFYLFSMEPWKGVLVRYPRHEMDGGTDESKPFVTVKFFGLG